MTLRALAPRHPDVVLVGGGPGCAGRAAEAWCKLLRVPCLAVEAASLDADAVVRAAGRAA
jgi:hypothetical protein